MWIISSDLPSYERYIENEGKLNNKKAMKNIMNIVEEPNIAKWFTLKKKKKVSLLSKKKRVSHKSNYKFIYL